MRLFVSAAILSLLATTAIASPTVTEIKAPDLPLPEVTCPGGKTLKLNLGIGSAAWRDPTDPAGVIWIITDRGPNLDCIGIDKITGISIDKLCAGDETAKNFALPEFTITFAKIEIGADNTAALLETIPLKGKSGKPVSGLPFTSPNFKLKTVAVMSPNEMIVMSDSDFGIEGDETQIRRITFEEPVLQ